MDILIYIYLLETFMWIFGNWCRAFQETFFVHLFKHAI